MKTEVIMFGSNTKHFIYNVDADDCIKDRTNAFDDYYPCMKKESITTCL